MHEAAEREATIGAVLEMDAETAQWVAEGDDDDLEGFDDEDADTNVVAIIRQLQQAQLDLKAAQEAQAKEFSDRMDDLGEHVGHATAVAESVEREMPLGFLKQWMNMLTWQTLTDGRLEGMDQRLNSWGSRFGSVVERLRTIEELAALLVMEPEKAEEADGATPTGSCAPTSVAMSTHRPTPLPHPPR